MGEETPNPFTLSRLRSFTGRLDSSLGRSKGHEIAPAGQPCLEDSCFEDDPTKISPNVD